MSDKNKKSPLEEAKLSFEEIQKFAQEEAASAINEQVAEKLKQLFEEKLNEDTQITIDGNGNVEISTDGEVVGAENHGAEDNHINLGNDHNADDTEDFVVSDEDDEIAVDENAFDYEKDNVKYGKDYLPEPSAEIHIPNMEETIQNQNMEEMNKMTMEAEAAAAAAPVAAAPAPEGAPAPTDAAPGVTPVEEAPAMPELLSKLDTLINIMMQQQSGAAAPAPGAEAGSEQEFDVIDDEAGAPAPGASAPAPAAPAMEEEIEIEDFEGNKDANFIDEMEEQMLEIVDEDNMPEAGPSVEETRSLGFTSKRTGDKALKMGTMKDEKGHHAPVTSLKENKAQDESKLDELIKENKSLKNEVKSLQGERKEFEDAFVDLRTQFNEMQLFNGKLALVNKVLMNGGLTVEEKIKICEQFDSAQTYEEANKLFKNIIKENNIKVGDATNKLKGNATNTAKPKSTSEPLYESDETKRLKKLAGIGKTEEDNY